MGKMRRNKEIHIDIKVNNIIRNTDFMKKKSYRTSHYSDGHHLRKSERHRLLEN